MLIDLLYLLFLGIFLFRGFRKGLILSLFSVLALLMGFAGATKLSSALALQLFADSPRIAKWAPLFTYILVFFLIVWLIKIIGSMLQKSLDLVALGFLNRLLGAFLYGFLISFLFSVFIWLFSKMGILNQDSEQESLVIPLLAPLAPKVFSILSFVFPFVKSSFESMNIFFDRLQNKLI